MFKLRSLKVKLKSEVQRFMWTTKVIGENICIQDNTVQEEYRFPYVWLRDNCQCNKCFHAVSNSRTIDIVKFDFDVKPEKIEVLESELKVFWSDNHYSSYNLPWLKQHRFSSQYHKYWLENIYRPNRKLWTAKEFSRVLQRFYLNDILERDEVLLSWLECLSVWGISIIKEAGVKGNTLLKLCDRIAFVKRTQYGELFSVIDKPDTSNVAYLSGPLQLHTDLPYYEYKPGVLMLHCLVQAEDEGGENVLSDGLAVCTDLKQNHPKDYKILTSTLVDWSDIVEEDGRKYHSLYRAPVIMENSSGDLMRMNFSQPQRDSHFNIPLEQVIPWYRAFKIFTQTLHSPQYKVQYRLNKGDILAFDNLRLAHGRCSYGGTRHLQGSYIDWDHVYSRIRVLRSNIYKNSS